MANTGNPKCPRCKGSGDVWFIDSYGDADRDVCFCEEEINREKWEWEQAVAEEEHFKKLEEERIAEERKRFKF